MFAKKLPIVHLLDSGRCSNSGPSPKEASGLHYKQVTIIIYDRNDSGQYYKTPITIVIGDPSLS